MHRIYVWLASALVVLASASLGGASTDAEWESAVTAAEQADPTIDPPLPGLDSVTIVGGTNTLATMAVAAKKDSGAVSGRMTLVASGTTVKARVICVTAVASSDGGGSARVIGEIENPTVTVRFLDFRIVDSGLGGGDGDFWDHQTLPVQPATCPVELTVTPLAAGNVAVKPG